MSQGDESPRGPWNEGPGWDYVESPEPAVGGGDGMATVNVSGADVKVLRAMAARTASDKTLDPTTGADLGAGQQSAEPEEGGGVSLAAHAAASRHASDAPAPEARSTFAPFSAHSTAVRAFPGEHS